MGKIAGLALAVVLLAGAGGSASAGQFGFGLTGGAAIPMGDFGDGFSTGFNAGGYAEYWFNDQGAFGIDLGYNRNGAKDEFNDALNAVTELALLLSGYTTADADLEIKASSLVVGVHGKWAPPTGSNAAPYIQGGLGMYNGSLAIEGPVTADGIRVDVDEDESETDVGINVGAGLLFKASPTMSIGVMGTFHNVFSEDESTQFFVVGAQVHFMTGAR